MHEENCLHQSLQTYQIWIKLIQTSKRTHITPNSTLHSRPRETVPENPHTPPRNIYFHRNPKNVKEIHEVMDT
jgi:hypothetical protein